MLLTSFAVNAKRLLGVEASKVENFETALKKNISCVLEAFYSEILFNARTFWRSCQLALENCCCSRFIQCIPGLCVRLYNQMGLYSDYPKSPIIIVVYPLNALIQKCHMKAEKMPLILLPSTAINIWKSDLSRSSSLSV